MLEKIQKISKPFITIFSLLLFVIPLFEFLKWFILGLYPFQAIMEFLGLAKYTFYRHSLIEIYNMQFTFNQKLLGFFGGVLDLFALFLGLVLLIKLFKNYHKGIIFSVSNTVYFKYLGYLFFIDGLITKPIANSLQSLALTLNNPKGYRIISITFSMINLETIFCGAIIIVIAKVMDIGYKMQEEQRLVI